MMLKKFSMKTTTTVALMAALAWPQTFASAQTTYSVVDCSDLEALPSMSTDAVIDFTTSPVTCGSNTYFRVTDDSTLEFTSSLEELNLVNVRVSLQSGSSLVVSAPNLQWQSEETREDRVGAALSVSAGATATFKEDVTFTGCSIVDQSNTGLSGAAVYNKGDIEFMSDATFTGTTEGGAVYSSGSVTFSGDAMFENNKKTKDFSTYTGGGGLFVEDGTVTFKGSASFVGNQAEQYYDLDSEGMLYYAGQGGGLFVGGDDGDGGSVVFEGPAFFTGNMASEGAGLALDTSSTVIFQSLVTFEDNVATSDGDASVGGAMAVDDGIVEFQAGVVATGNIAKDGGAFNLVSSDAVVIIEGPVTMTGNEARYQGGAIWNRGNMTLPLDAYISGNTAPMCPGFKNYEDWEQSDPVFSGIPTDPDGFVEFSDGGSMYSGSSIDLCYLGEDLGEDPGIQYIIDSDAAACDALFDEGTTLGGYSVLTWDTRQVSEINFAVGSGELFDVSCANLSIIFVMGGGELTVKSTTDTLAFTNIRFEVGGYTDLYFDIPELTMAGIDTSRVGGSTHVDKGSSLEFWGDVSFVGNTVDYQTDSAWNEYGGACVFNAGLVKFRGTAYFRSNGQYEQHGRFTWNSPGGAILNVGDMEFERTAKFWSNFNLNGGNGGGIANSGQVSFNLRTVWRNNTVDDTGAEEGSRIIGGHGAALYNFGPVATATLLSKATFRDNTGGFRGGAVGANGDRGRSVSTAENGNKITFAHETTFKDNGFDDTRPDNAGAGLWVYKNATVEFQDKVVFRRNEAANGGAIINGGGFLKFASADLVSMIDNVGVETCPDIKNYDKEDFSHEDSFGDIDDPTGECGSSGDLCTWYEGEVTIGSAAPIVGETADLCEF